MARIGIYGGSFNPPHLGHIRGAGYAKKALKLDRLILIPAGIPPHKQTPQNSAAAEQRLEMTRIAAAGEGLEVSDMELRRGGVSYTYETVEALRAMHPGDELVLLMGTDMYLSFPKWREPQRILNCASLGVLYRGAAGEKEAILSAMEQTGINAQLVENPVVPISSTQLRRMLILRCAGEFLPEGVLSYIREHGLYGTQENYKNLPVERLERVVENLLKPNRVAHVLGCRDTAVALAKHYGCDVTNAERAALLHDVTKALDGSLQLTLCREYGMISGDFSSPATLHALTGSLAAERIFGENPEVVSAIRWHSTGKPNMTTLEKIIYIADYTEPNRNFPGVQALRSLLYTDLDEAVRLGLSQTLAFLREQGSAISPETQAALDYLENSVKKG